MEIIPPSNAVGDEGYHVLGRPGAVIPLKVRLTNLKDETLEIYTAALNAYSGPNGMFYQSPGEVDAQTVALVDEQFGLAECLDVADTVMLIAKQSTIVNFYVEVPLMKAGMLLGSIRFTAYKDGQKPDAETNEHQTADAVIRVNLPVEAQPSVTVGVPTTDGAALRIPIANNAAAIANTVSCIYEIQSEAGSVLLEGEAVLPQMAPMTEYRVSQPLKDGPLADGVYTVHSHMSVDGQASDITVPFVVGSGAITPVPTQSALEPTPSARETEPTPSREASPTQPQPEATPDHIPAISGESIQAIPKAAAPAVAVGVPAVFACIILHMALKNRGKAKRSKPKHLAQRRYAARH